jgi:hypothetical protein
VKHPFFFTALSFSESELVVRLQKMEPWAIVKFDLPRAFRFFNESDNPYYLENYEGSTLLQGEQGCCIISSVTSVYLIEYLNQTPESRLEHGLRSIIIITPQECVEVISFEDPSIEMIQRGNPGQ